MGYVAGCQFAVLLLAGLATATANKDPNFRRNPAPNTLAECLAKQAPGSGTTVPIQVLKSCMGQVQKREVDEEQDGDATSYIIDGGKPNIVVV